MLLLEDDEDARHVRFLTALRPEDAHRPTHTEEKVSALDGKLISL